MITFSYNGRIGDIVYSLWYVKELSERICDKVNYHIQTNVKIPNPTDVDRSHMNSTVYMSRQSAQFVKPFLQKCQFINEVTIGDQVPANAQNFDVMKTKFLNTFGGQMRDYCYNFFFDQFDLPREYWKPVLDVDANNRYSGKVLFTLSQRYVNGVINYNLLQQFKDLLVFIGTEKQFNIFNQNYFELNERCAPTSLLEVAQLMKGAVGYISNQTGFFAVAEAIKVPRILLPCDLIKQGKQYVFGPKNVLPLGGWCQNISIDQKLVPSLIQMLQNN